MAHLYSCILLLVLGVAQAADNIDHVQIVIKAVPNFTNKSQAMDRAAALMSREHQPLAACEVTVYEHWAAGVAGKEDYQGDSKTFQGTGKNPFGAYQAGTSSVKVSGRGCVAYGYTSEDCSGEKNGNAISSSTEVEGLPAGTVSPSDELVKYWVCDNCIRCVEVTQGDSPDNSPSDISAPTATPTTCTCSGGTAAIGEACTKDGEENCAACNQDNYLSGATCAACTTCSANAEVKTACTLTSDSICQCSRGYIGLLGNACAPCNDKTYTDTVDQSACTKCEDGADGENDTGGDTANTGCKNSLCQRPSASANAHVDTDNCPDNAQHDTTCSLKCNTGYEQASKVDFTCKEVVGSEEASYQDGSITCNEYQCSCPNGQGATGANCPANKDAKCASCESGYDLELEGNVFACIAAPWGVGLDGNGYASITKVWYLTIAQQTGYVQIDWPIVTLTKSVTDPTLKPGEYALSAGCGDLSGQDACTAICKTLGLALWSGWSVAMKNTEDKEFTSQYGLYSNGFPKKCKGGYPNGAQNKAATCVWKATGTQPSDKDDWNDYHGVQTQICRSPMDNCQCEGSLPSAG